MLKDNANNLHATSCYNNFLERERKHKDAVNYVPVPLLMES